MRRVVLVAVVFATVVSVIAWRSSTGDRAQVERRPMETVKAAPPEPSEARLPAGASAGQKSAAESAAVPAIEEPAVLVGVVTGQYGGLWGARVAVFRAGGDRLLAEIYSDTDGRFSFSLDAEPVDLLVEPAGETNLQAVRSDGIHLVAGETREVSVALVDGGEIAGRVVNELGDPLGNVRVVAVPVDVAPAGDGVHPNDFRAHERTSAKTDREGRFHLRALPKAAYRILIGQAFLMLRAPVRVWPDDDPLELVAVPALSLDLYVRDIETEEPVKEFEVRLSYETGARLATFPGKAGRFARRIRWPARVARFAKLEVVAHGYVMTTPVHYWLGMSDDRPRTVWLRPKREPNLTLRVRYDDGTPYRGGVLVVCSETGSRRSGRIDMTEKRPGVFVGSLPRGRWTLTMRVVSLMVEKRIALVAAIDEQSDLTHELTLPAGGALIVKKPPGWKKQYLAILRRMPESKEEERRSGRLIQIGDRPVRLEGLQPGVYQLAYHSNNGLQWVRDVTVVRGGEATVEMPRY